MSSLAAFFTSAKFSLTASFSYWSLIFKASYVMHLGNQIDLSSLICLSTQLSITKPVSDSLKVLSFCSIDYISSNGSTFLLNVLYSLIISSILDWKWRSRLLASILDWNFDSIMLISNCSFTSKSESSYSIYFLTYSSIACYLSCSFSFIYWGVSRTSSVILSLILVVVF